MLDKKFKLNIQLFAEGDDNPKVEEPTVDPNAELERLKKEIEDLRISKEKAEQLEKLVAEKESNEKYMNTILEELKAEKEDLRKIAEENAETSKAVKERDEIITKQKIEAEKATVLKQLADEKKRADEAEKRAKMAEERAEFKEFKDKLMEEKGANTLLVKAIRLANNKSEIDFALRAYDNQEIVDLAKMSEVAGDNAFKVKEKIVLNGDSDKTTEQLIEERRLARLKKTTFGR